MDNDLSIRNLLDIDIVHIENDNQAFLIKYQNHVVGYGYTNLYDIDNLKDQSGSSEWKMFPRKIPVYDEYSAIVKWYDGSHNEYKLGVYSNSIDIIPWVENIWHNIKQKEFENDQNQSIFNRSFENKFKKVKSINQAKDLFDMIKESLCESVNIILKSYQKIK